MFVSITAMTDTILASKNTSKLVTISDHNEGSVCGDIAHADVDTLLEMLTYKDGVIEKKSSVIEEQKQRIAILEEYLRLERVRRFGPSSEKSPDQAELFNEAETIEDTADCTRSVRLAGSTTRFFRQGLCHFRRCTRINNA
jgi:hypothetical protein